MKIGVDIRCLMDKNRTGVGEYTYGLLNAIFEIDKINQYFLFYNSYQDISVYIPKWQQKNLHFIIKHWPNKFFNLLLSLRLIKLDKFAPVKLDVWFSPNLHYTCLSRKIKQILTIHDLSFVILPECFPFKWRLAYKILNPKRQCRRADIILTPSENTKHDIVNSYQIVDLPAGRQGSKIQILRPGLSLGIGHKAEDIRKKYNLPEKYILFLGTLEPRKNVETLIEAYQKIQTSPLPRRQAGFPSPTRGGLGGVSLVIAGAPGWKNKKLMHLIEDTPNVKYVGYVDDEEKQVLYQNASLFVFPSLYEGFGIPVLEAMACGVPVITSNRSSLPEVGGDAVCYVNPHNVVELAENMKLILENIDLRKKMIEKEFEVSKEFNRQKSAGEFIKLLHN
ncbi:MAG: Glycosyl transferase group 1 [Candidatus Magasanikbacteria bacterium GW2011_GWC2_37_14]|uniref:Glycosyl transferase group 1 n=1 Tax=Candidatus Magasanikbacteria bacterium GW2011_GWC2_37_14 TaxID=1619046 RepID=A0A0G0GBN9_9BACT|nr:MAG: Glycosyl transferase group 1 [Candidatus Magasanikbacteria bacterium GW2011_GWC2_37_14]